MSGGDVMVLIAVAGQFCLVGLIIFIVAHRLEQKAALRAQLELKLIERFSNAKELEEFLSTDAGRRLLDGHRRYGGSQLGKIVGAIQGGIVLLVLGLGMMGLAAFLGHKEPFGVGILMFALGSGFLVAAAVARRLVRAWRLDEREDAPTLREPGR
jgi:hypothetical protein